MVGESSLRIILQYGGDVKCFSRTFQFNQDNENFYEAFVEYLYKNRFYKESFICSNELLKNENKKEIYFVTGVKSLIKLGSLENAQKLAS